MNFKKVYYKDINREEWEQHLRRMPDAGIYHSWHFINYQSQFAGVKENLSFIFFDTENKPVAVCPLGISQNQNEQYIEISFGGNPCGAPLVIEARPSTRRKILDDVFAGIMTASVRCNVKKINMIWDPLVNNFCNGTSYHKNHFELMRYGLQYYVENTLVVNLQLDEESLQLQLTSDRKKNIKKAKKKEVAFKVFDNNNLSESKKYFELFQQAHFKSAGKMTRPQETWDVMYLGIINGDAALFALFVEAIPISFLYCGQYGQAATSWSQVNDDEFEAEYSPRHLLEWETILFYKNKGYKYYEIGERYFEPQLTYIPSGKEKSISVFKERFGGEFLPKIRWTGYLDKDCFLEEYKNHFNRFIASVPLMSLPQPLNIRND